MWPGFAADYHPMNLPQIDPGQRANKRLAGKEADGRGHFAQVIDAIEDPAVFHAHAHPDILRPRQFRGQLAHPVAPLRQHLKGMLRTFFHRLENPLDEPKRHVRMK